MKNKYYTKNVLNEMILESVNRIYYRTSLKASITNVGSDSGENTRDIAG